MKLIKTTKKMRALYTKHLDMLEGLASGETGFPDCYMCEAAKVIDREECPACPISCARVGVSCSHRRQLKGIDGKQVNSYHLATPESIRKRADWIAEQITKFTDCEVE